MSHQPPSIDSPLWTARTKRIVALLVVAVAGLAVVRFSDTLPMLAVALILAYLLSPLAMFIERRLAPLTLLSERNRRGVAVLLTLALVILALIVISLLVLPVIIKQFEEFGSRLPQLMTGLGASIERALNEPLTLGGDPILIDGEPVIPLERLRQITGTPGNQPVIRLQDLNLVGATQAFISSLTVPAFSFLGGALTAIVNLLLLLSILFYLIRDGALFADRLVQLTPPLYRNDMRRLLYELAQVWNAYLRGQITLSLIMGTAAFLLATILGIPNPIILGIISGLLEFIPSIGSGLAIFPAALLALASQSSTFPFLEGGAFMVVAIVGWAILQNIEAIILVPRVMGGSLNLHPVAVIVAVVIGANLAGALGIVLAAPSVATLRVFGQYIYGKLFDVQPFPPIRATQARPTPPRWVMRRVWLSAARQIEARFGQPIRSRLRRKADHAR